MIDAPRRPHARALAPTLSLLVLGCFDPAVSRDDTTTGLSGTSTGSTVSASSDDPSATSANGTSTGQSSVDGSSSGPGENTEGMVTTDGVGTTFGTSTSTGPGTTGDSSTGMGSSSTGPTCVPGPAQLEFESLGAFVSQGDAWQAFGVGSTGEIVEVNLYWNLSGTNDSFTINIYEGEGTAGPLLHSELFPGQGMGTFVGFDSNPLSVPVPVTAGSVYTMEGVDTFGWQTANGGIAGVTSSLGPAQHKNIQVWIEPCL